MKLKTYYHFGAMLTLLTLLSGVKAKSEEPERQPNFKRINGIELPLPKLQPYYEGFVRGDWAVVNRHFGDLTTKGLRPGQLVYFANWSYLKEATKWTIESTLDCTISDKLGSETVGRLIVTRFEKSASSGPIVRMDLWYSVDGEWKVLPEERPIRGVHMVIGKLPPIPINSVYNSLDDVKSADQAVLNDVNTLRRNAERRIKEALEKAKEENKPEPTTK